MRTWPDSRLGRVLALLERQHGRILPPRLKGPFEMILWEIVAYLADDAQRAAAFEALRKRVGLAPGKILAAPLQALREAARTGGSIAVVERAERLQIAARLAADGKLDGLLSLPAPKAKKALMQFPMIGEPGAEKILLFCGALDVLALESNGLRVLLRIGIAEERKSYAATYKAAREVTMEELPGDAELLARAHLLLRRHGQEVCLRSNPICGSCGVSDRCEYYHGLH